MKPTLQQITDWFNKTKSNKRSTPDAIFSAFVNQSYSVLLTIYERDLKEVAFKNKYVTHIKHNFLVNLVTALEIYFKNVVIKYDFWNTEGYEKLLRDKITLHEAFDFFAKGKVTRQYIVSHHYSFHGLDKINYLLSTLCGDDLLLTKIEAYEYRILDFNKGKVHDSSLLQQFPKWRNRIQMLFEIRNRFTHDGITQSITDAEIQEYYSIVRQFQHSFELFLTEKSKRKKKSGIMVEASPIRLAD